MISQFGFILLFFISGILLVTLVLFIAKFLRPNRPNEQKNTIYESGEQTEGVSQVAFNMRFYIVALVFILFDVELVILFPWAIIFGDAKLVNDSNGLWALFTGIEMLIFVLVLGLGLMYAWLQGHLEWIRPVDKNKKFKSVVPKELYDKVNEKYQ
jgi:NADH-quinone oxidoreductase subunit A